MSAEAITSLDGRRARREQSREAIVEALLLLLRQGRNPSSTEIAAAAGVTQRTLFNHFRDLPALVTEVAKRQWQYIAEHLPNVSEQGELAARVQIYIAELAPLLEELAPARMAVHRAQTESAPIQQALRRIRMLMRERLSKAFAPELRSPEQSHLLDNLEIATDPVSWWLLRKQLGLSRTAAAKHLQSTVLALLSSALPKHSKNSQRLAGAEEIPQ